MDKELEIRLSRLELMTILAAKNVLDIHDMALLLKRSEKTIRNRLNEIPHYYGPMGLAFKKDEVEAWLCKVELKPIY